MELVPFAPMGKAALAPVREAGGDNAVPRDAKDRPRIIIFCEQCDRSGRVPSEKRPGNTVQCKKCKGEGQYLRSYTRTTTYIDCIEDKSNLDAWNSRMVLIGVARDMDLLLGVLERDPALKEDKDWLNRRAEVAKDVAGANDKSEKGTELHALSELADQGIDLPTDITFNDVIDIDAYMQITRGLSIVHMEKLVVHDVLGIGGTPDRVSRWIGQEGVTDLVAPDGTVIDPDDLLITDLKTGTVEYGALKMAMQLAIYSRSELYDHTDGSRAPLERIRQDWGLIINVPAGSGEGAVYWADLTLGWEAVEVATMVRSMRTRSRKALVAHDTLRTLAAA